MDKYYVVNLLKDKLDENQEELDRANDKINYLRNRLSISTSKQDYVSMKKDLDLCEKDRGELRGRCSALRQAIAKLEKEE
jgi:predicted  nucleic acid-binding Zn-ribbon protein